MFEDVPSDFCYQLCEICLNVVAIRSYTKCLCKTPGKFAINHAVGICFEKICQTKISVPETSGQNNLFENHLN